MPCTAVTTVRGGRSNSVMLAIPLLGEGACRKSVCLPVYMRSRSRVCICKCTGNQRPGMRRAVNDAQVVASSSSKSVPQSTILTSRKRGSNPNRHREDMPDSATIPRAATERRRNRSDVILILNTVAIIRPSTTCHRGI
ncbi:hypothetical protein LIA77_10029 [Sarocladium implicatum]|nr:hypothetical protein LIA77_10029 [Sarocladium implicatum]